MANQIHVKKLKEGVASWNKWRKDHPEIEPDLRNEDLQKRDLVQIDFRRTNLDGADLSEVNLSSAHLNSASLYQADLEGATLCNAVLFRTYFKETILRRTNFHKASLLDTMFLTVDLSETINLENVLHQGASTIGIDTIQHSRGKIHDTFLSGAGVSKQLLVSIRELGAKPFDYYTCFMSHSSQNQLFVDILYRDLSKEGVHCWYAPRSLQPGDKFPMYVTEEIQSREKVIIVLSKNSLNSSWVEKEVKLARQKERNGKSVLVPIGLDNAIDSSSVDWAVKIRKSRHITSFENWQQPSNYQKQLKALLGALRKQ